MDVKNPRARHWRLPAWGTFLLMCTATAFAQQQGGNLGGGNVEGGNYGAGIPLGWLVWVIALAALVGVLVLLIQRYVHD